jgi:2-acylglycerol O-acyltransferase 2
MVFAFLSSIREYVAQLGSYLGVLCFISLFIVSALFGIGSLFHPWLLALNEIVRNIPIPSVLMNKQFVSWCSESARDYFSHKLIYTQPKESYNFEQQLYIKCFMPHGVLPFGGLCILGDSQEQDAFGVQNNRLVMAHQIWEFAFLNQAMKAMGGIPAGYKEMFQTLKDGNSIMICPGGVRQAVISSHQLEKIAIMRRKGMFRLALQTGTPLIPIYTFGLSEVYHRSGVAITLPFLFGNDKDTFAWQWGRWWTAFPLQVPLTTVVGNPISVEKVLEPTEEQILQLREQYCKAVRELFEEWKGKYSERWREKQMIFV